MRHLLALLLLCSLALAAGPKKDGVKAKAKSKPERSPDDTMWVNQPKPGQLPPRTTHLTFHSAAMNKEIGYCVYLPPEYESNKNARFPVIYNLHGNGGNEIHGAQNVEILEAGVKAGKWPAMIMVMPNAGFGTFYMDSADGKIMAETLVIKELIPLIDKNYRTIAARHGRVVEGFSMGALGSVQLAMKHPELFCSVGGYAGGMQKLTEMASRASEISSSYKRMLGEDPAYWAKYDAFANARKNAQVIRVNQMAIRLWCGTADDYHLASTRWMHQLLTELKIPHDYREFPGLEHNSRKMWAETAATLYEFHAVALKKAAAAAR